MSNPATSSSSNAASALAKGGVAVITGAASGIGLAAAHALAERGLRLALCDVDLGKLRSATDSLRSRIGDDQVLLHQADVSDMKQVEAFRDATLAAFGSINVLMLNAAVSRGGPTFASESAEDDGSSLLSDWRRLLDVNLFGIVNGTQAFVPSLMKQNKPSVVVVTGSKQGFTCPPGNAAYNVSKAAVKCLTEQLAHELRQKDANCSAHLFVPGWTHTGMTTGGDASRAKAAGAWTAEQTVSFMLDRLAAGHFYILVPDNETSESLDRLRIAWSAADPVEGRPALSRWHPAYKDEFEAFVRDGLRGEAS